MVSKVGLVEDSSLTLTEKKMRPVLGLVKERESCRLREEGRAGQVQSQVSERPIEGLYWGSGHAEDGGVVQGRWGGNSDQERGCVVCVVVFEWEAVPSFGVRGSATT